MRIPYLFVFLAFAGISCSKTITPGATTGTGEYLIYGISGGFAPMLKFYKLADGKLMEDTTHKSLNNQPKDVTGFKFDKPVPDSTYRKVAGVIHEIPAALFSANNKTFGTTFPDAQTLTVYTQRAGVRYQWNFEADLDNESPEIRAFAAKLKFY